MPISPTGSPAQQRLRNDQRAIQTINATLRAAGQLISEGRREGGSTATRDAQLAQSLIRQARQAFNGLSGYVGATQRDNLRHAIDALDKQAWSLAHRPRAGRPHGTVHPSTGPR
jgi:hypothetical protein